MPEPKPTRAPSPRRKTRSGLRMASLLDIPPAAAGGALEEVGERRTLASVEHVMDARTLCRQHFAQGLDALVVAAEGRPQRVHVERLGPECPGKVSPRLLPLTAEAFRR